MFNKHNFKIAEMPVNAKDKYFSCPVIMEKNRTVATNGRQLIIVDAPDMPADEYPAITGVELIADFEPFQIDFLTAKTLGKSIPKSRLPILEHVNIGKNPEGKTCFVTTDTKTTSIPPTQNHRKVGSINWGRWCCYILRGNHCIYPH